MYTEEQLVKFGEYLLSEERTNRIASSYNNGDSINLSERLRAVYDADIRNCFEGMSFEEAMVELFNGKKVTRWSDRYLEAGTYTDFLQSKDPFVSLEPLIIIRILGGGHQLGWLALEEDIKATDWKVL